MNGYQKKWLAVILVLSMLAAMMPGLPADKISAKSHVHKGTLTLIQDGALITAENDSARAAFSKNSQRLRSKAKTETITQVREVVYRGLLLMEEEIDVSTYQVEYEDFTEIVQDLMNSSAELFHVSSHYSLYTDRSDVYVLSYIPEYNFDEAETFRMREEFNAVVSHILSGMNPDWSDKEKALYVHDTLTSQCEYDESMQKYDAYSLLVDGTSVCQGYTLAYNYLMERVGIPCASVPSSEMKHIWNQIAIDGTWYHVDLTYDDPLTDIPGAAMHDNFLLSDTGIQKTGHKNWVSIYPCRDISYDDADYFWKSSMAPFQNDGNHWYFVESSDDGQGNAGIYQWNPADDATERFLDLSQEKWQIGSSNHSYSSKFTGLGIWNGTVYFNTAKDIRFFSVDAPAEIHVLELPQISGSIFGLRIKNNVLEYVTGMQADDLTDVQIAKKLEAPGVSYEWPSPTPSPTHTPVPEPTDTPIQNPSQKPAEISTAPAVPSVPQPVQTANAAQSSTRVQTDISTVPTRTPASESTKISVTAKKGTKKLTIRVHPGTKTIISMNRKIIKKKKKRSKKITVPAAQNKSGIIKLTLSSRLKKKMRITVTVYQSGRKVTKKITIK